MFNRAHRFSFSQKIPSHVFSSPFFVMRYEKTSAPFRMALVASKKIDKRSTVRNKAKRKLFHVLQDSDLSKLPMNAIFYLKKNIISAQQEDINREVERALKHVNVI